MAKRSDIAPARPAAPRAAAVQALYQMDMTGIDLNQVIAEFAAHRWARRSKATATPMRSRNSSVTSSRAWCASSFASILDRQAARRGLAAHARRFPSFAPSFAPAPMRSSFVATCRYAWSSPNMSILLTRFSARRPKVVNSILDRLGHRERPQEFAAGGDRDG